MSNTTQQSKLEKARERFKNAFEGVQRQYRQSINDLRFVYEDFGQWDQKDIDERKRLGHPSLQIDKLKKYSKQVCGEGRKNKIRVKIRPVDTEADEEIAKIRSGMVYDIEYKSNAESIYDYARRMVVDSGFGAWRIITRPKKKNPFQYEIIMKRIKNPFTVFMDPYSDDTNYTDAKFGFIQTKIPREEFNQSYPKAQAPVDTSDSVMGQASWYDENTVSIIEYFYTDSKEKKMVQLSDGRVMEKKDAQELVENALEIYDAADIRAQQKAIGEGIEPELSDRTQLLSIVDETTVIEEKIKWCKMTAFEILEETDWAGDYIPLVVVKGDEINIDGEDHVFGLLHNGIDAQKLSNLTESSIAEYLEMGLNQPWKVTPKQIAGLERSYAEAYKKNVPFIIYNPDPAAPPPMRDQGVGIPAGLFQQRINVDENIKSSVGMYNADVGDQGRELSGIAIAKRQAPGDTATFMFLDNMSKAIGHSGKIINNLLDKINDTEQDISVRNEDDTETFAPINTTLRSAYEKIRKNPNRYNGMDLEKLQKEMNEQSPDAPFNHIGVGEYDVVVSTGPAFETQRQEAASALVDLTSAANGSPYFGALLYYATKHMDFDSAQELSDSIRRMLPQGVVPPNPGEEPPKPQPPSPQEQMAMQAQKVKLETDMINRQVQLEKTIVEQERRRTEQMQQMNEAIKMMSESQDRAIDNQAARMLETLRVEISKVQNRSQQSTEMLSNAKYGSRQLK